MKSVKLEPGRQKTPSLIRIASVLFWLALWQAAALFIGNSIILASPLETGKALVSQLFLAEFWSVFFSSCLRISLGFLGAFLLAAVFGAAAYFLSPLRELLAPAVLLMKAVPVVSFVILALIWAGSKRLSLFISFVVVFPMIYESVLAGLASADSGLLEMAQVFRIPFTRTFRFIYLPALLPYLAANCRSAIGMGIKSEIAAEVIGIPEHSIGEQLYTAKIYLETDRLFAWTAVIIAMSWFLERGFLILLEKAGQRLHTSASIKTAVRKKAGVPASIPSGRIEAMAGSLLPQEVCARHLSKSYQNRPVLSDVSLTVQPGERCALMAPSGMGKTTLFRLLLGLETAEQGNIQTASAGAVFQENRLIESLSPIENVRLALPPLPRADTQAELFSILSSLLPAESLTRPVSTLSGGMKRRCALARALLSPSEILILDEPFTGLDEDTKKQAVQFIETWQKGRPLLFSTHDPKDVLLLQARLLPVNFKQS